VLQFSDDNFRNNLYQMERLGTLQSQCYLRPYLSADTGAIRFEESLLARFFRALHRNSFLFRRLDAIVQGMQRKYYGSYSKALGDLQRDRLEKDSYRVTKQILALLRSELGKKTQLFLMVDAAGGAHSVQRQVTLAKESGFIPLVSPSADLVSLARQGAVIHHADGNHLSVLGNKILGESLATELYRHIPGSDRREPLLFTTNE
jgi:hypothetical protein